jgi:L-iditol 2-dehydrogenase
VESPDPVPEDNEILVSVRAVSICPSDHHIYKEGHASGVYPDHEMILGHEFSGVVAKAAADGSGPAEGTRVAIEPAWHCGHCDICKRGLINICRNVIFPSYPNRDGALAEYIACPSFSAAPLPDNVDFVAAALAEPLGVAIHAVRHANLGFGDVVAILGVGVIGTALVELCKLAGVRSILVVDPNESRHAVPLELGADAAYTDKDQLIEDVGGTEHGPSVVFDVTNGQDSFSHSVDVCEPGGQIIVITIPPHDHAELTASTARRKELDIQFSRRSRHTLEEAVRLVSEGRVHPDRWPRKEFSLDETGAAFECSTNPPHGMVRAVVKVGE